MTKKQRRRKKLCQLVKMENCPRSNWPRWLSRKKRQLPRLEALKQMKESLNRLQLRQHRVKSSCKGSQLPTRTSVDNWPTTGKISSRSSNGFVEVVHPPRQILKRSHILVENSRTQ